MTKPDLMVLCTLSTETIQQLEADYHLHRWDQAEDKEDFLNQFGPACRAAISSGHTPLTAAMLDAMPALEMVSCISAGYDSMDIPEMARRGIRLTNASPALRDDVADMAILLMLAAHRAFVAGDAHVRTGDWAKQGAMPLQRKVSGQSLGIVGMGSLGEAVAQRAQAFGMAINYWNRRPKDVGWTHQPDLLQLARNSDTLILTVAGGEETAGLISAEVIEALGPKGLLVNVARGTVIDEPAMIRALASGALGHAALDVFLQEPDPDPQLTSLPNVTLSPHHASGTVETRRAMAQLAVDNLSAFFAGKPLLSEVPIGSATR